MKHEMLLNIMDNFTGEKSTEELINEYHRGNKDVIIAFVYETGYPQFSSISNKFLGLDEATKESVILEQIWKGLENYQIGSKAKLTSLICTYIYNELRHFQIILLEMTMKEVKTNIVAWVKQIQKILTKWN